MSDNIPVWRVCYTCRDYIEHRAETLVIAIAEKADRQKRDAVDITNEFMLAAHGRHMSGTPLRENGPTRLLNPQLGRIAALMGMIEPSALRKSQL